LYATTSFLDKSHTKNDWFEILDPQHTRLSLDVVHHMIHYAVYDCLSVTFLRLPVIQRWSLIQLEKTPIHILLFDSKQIILDLDLEYISEDELPQVIQSSLLDNNQQQIDEVINEESKSIIECSSSFDQNLRTSTINLKSKHSQRSAEARTRRNQKRNTAHRLHRYLYCLIRSLYHRFTMKKVEKILIKFKIKSIHIKPKNNQLIIGVQNEKFEQLLTIDIFDRKHYYSH